MTPAAPHAHAPCRDRHFRTRSAVSPSTSSENVYLDAGERRRALRPTRPSARRGPADVASGQVKLDQEARQSRGARVKASNGKRRARPGSAAEPRGRRSTRSRRRVEFDREARQSRGTPSTSLLRPAARNKRPRPGTTAPKKARQTTRARPRHPQEPARPPGRHKGRKTDNVTTRTTQHILAPTAATWHNHTNGNPAPRPLTPTPTNHPLEPIN